MRGYGGVQGPPRIETTTGLIDAQDTHLGTYLPPNGETLPEEHRHPPEGEQEHRKQDRAENLEVERPSRSVTLQAGRPTTVEWRARRVARDLPWAAVVVPNGDVSRRREAGSGH